MQKCKISATFTTCFVRRGVSGFELLSFAAVFVLFSIMTANQIDYANIGLMLVALVAGFLLPFEVFLFSYAFLGPLHYLTEISWLHDRQYFSPKKWDWVPIAILGVLILIGAKAVMGPEIVGRLESFGLGGLVAWADQYVYDITFFAFGLAFIFVIFKDWTYRTAGIMVLLLAAWIFVLPEPVSGPITTQAQYDVYEQKYSHVFFKIFAVYTPTLIHVYLFTGAFILFGALKRRSSAGYLSFAAFVTCALACLLITPGDLGYAPTEWAVSSYAKTFESLNMYLMMDLGQIPFRQINEFNIFNDPLSIQFTRFIAFAYTYHYLNWFSKTSVIQWHKVPKARFLVVIVLWVASIALYLYNYSIGFRWLFLLSFLHVLLEFPLNHQSFIGIAKELSKMISRKPQAAKT